MAIYYSPFNKKYDEYAVSINLISSDILNEDGIDIRVPKTKSKTIRVHIYRNGDDGRRLPHGPRIKYYLREGRGNQFVDFPTHVDEMYKYKDGAVPVDVTHRSVSSIKSDRQDIFDTVGAFACYCGKYLKMLHDGSISQDNMNSIITRLEEGFNSLDIKDIGSYVAMARRVRIK